MAFISRSELQGYGRGFSTANVAIAAKQAAATPKYQWEAKATIFLSHSHKDRDLIAPAIAFLRSHGVMIYVDWMDEGMPDVVSGETAKKLKDRIRQQNKFLVLVTENSKDSRWVPWELGFADSAKGMQHIATFPIREDAPCGPHSPRKRHQLRGIEREGADEEDNENFSGLIVLHAIGDFNSGSTDKGPGQSSPPREGLTAGFLVFTLNRLGDMRCPSDRFRRHRKNRERKRIFRCPVGTLDVTGQNDMLFPQTGRQIAMLEIEAGAARWAHLTRCILFLQKKGDVALAEESYEYLLMCVTWHLLSGLSNELTGAGRNLSRTVRERGYFAPAVVLAERILQREFEFPFFPRTQAVCATFSPPLAYEEIPKFGARHLKTSRFRYLSPES